MAKFGRFSPDRWNSLMPAHSPAGQRGPWYYRNTEALVITYLTDEDTVLDIMPEDLELIEPATAIMVVEKNHKTTLGPYDEIYTAVMCKWRDETLAYCNGVYVTGEASQILGREALGFGKKRADSIEFTNHTDQEVEAVVNIRPGEPAVTVRALPTVREPAESVVSIPLVVLKTIPDVEGGEKPALAQLVSVLFQSVPQIGTDGNAEVYSGPATIEFGADSDVSLPVKEVLGCTYMHMYADLPYGKILKTYF